MGKSMSGSSGKVREISLGDGIAEVVVEAKGIRIELHADGSIKLKRYIL
jgi:hypothetical protein